MMKSILFALISTVAATNAFADQKFYDNDLKQLNIKSIEELKEIAKNQVPNSTIIHADTYVEKDDDSGIYEYDAEVRDAQGQRWEITINAKTHAIIEKELDND